MCRSVKRSLKNASNRKLVKELSERKSKILKPGWKHTSKFNRCDYDFILEHYFRCSFISIH